MNTSFFFHAKAPPQGDVRNFMQVLHREMVLISSNVEGFAQPFGVLRSDVEHPQTWQRSITIILHS